MKITQKLIDKALETRNTSLLPVFCIVKDNQKNKVDQTIRTVYWAVTEPNERNSVEIQRNMALKLIDLFHLKAFNECQRGAVYDTIDKQYRQKFRGYAVL